MFVSLSFAMKQKHLQMVFEIKWLSISAYTSKLHVHDIDVVSVVSKMCYPVDNFGFIIRWNRSQELLIVSSMQ